MVHADEQRLKDEAAATRIDAPHIHLADSREKEIIEKAFLISVPHGMLHDWYEESPGTRRVVELHQGTKSRCTSRSIAPGSSK